MAIRLDPVEARRERSQSIASTADDWLGQQLAAGLDGPTPDDRKADSDYNLHVPEMEAPGGALDDLFGAMP